MNKEIMLIGDFLGGDELPGTSGWVMTQGGPRYKVGPRDSLAVLSHRYLGSFQYEKHILSMQSRDIQNRGIRTGDLLVMPQTAINNAHALGMLPEGTWESKVREDAADADLGDLTDIPNAWSSAHSMQEHINVVVGTIQATVQQDTTTAKKIDNATLSAWTQFRQAWNDFRDHEPAPWWGIVETGLYLNTLINRYQAMKNQWGPESDGWSKRISSITGGLVGPVQPNPEPPSPPGGSTDDSGGGSTFKWLAVAAIVAGVAYSFGPALRAIGQRKR